MKLREVAPLVLMVVLGGCGGADLDQAFNYVGIGGKDEQAPPPSQQPAASAGERACGLALRNPGNAVARKRTADLLGFS